MFPRYGRQCLGPIRGGYLATGLTASPESSKVLLRATFCPIYSKVIAKLRCMVPTTARTTTATTRALPAGGLTA